MKLINWNIQWARGMDGIVDARRIVDDARALADFDVLCLQEVAANFPALGVSEGENQFEQFARLLPGFTPVPAAGVDIAAPDGVRRCFGNMLLSRYPVLRVLRHQLPWPLDPDAISMPRVLIEATLDTPLGAVRVMTTHLEYYSASQRARQVEAVRALHEESCLRAAGGRGQAGPESIFHAGLLPTATVLTGDFNLRPDDPLHGRLCQPFGSGIPRLHDAWRALHGDAPHPHTVGVHDRQQWPQPFACDFIFVSEDLLPDVKRFEVDGGTAASDHQPLLLELGEGRQKQVLDSSTANP